MNNNIFSTNNHRGSEPDGKRRHSPTEFNTGAPCDSGIDLNEQLIKNRPTTFFMRVNSNAMVGAAIHVGDVVIVDRSIEPKDGSVVIAVLDGEMLIRKFEINNYKRRLLPATSELSAIEISESSSFTIWGVVTYVIHSL
ncbi:MAG: LexA family protein [Flavisolibacter sp.]